MSTPVPTEASPQSRLRARHALLVLWLLCSVLVAAPALAVADCDYTPATFEVRDAGQVEFRPLGARLSLPPRLRPTTSEIRFRLPPSHRDCFLLIDRVSLYGLRVEVDGQPPVEFDFFRPRASDRFAATGYVVALQPSGVERSVVLRITQLGVLSSQIARVDLTELLARERRISAMHSLSLVAPLLMAALVLLFWLRLRDRALAAYLLLLASLVLVTASLDGTLYFFDVGAPFAALRSMAHILLLSLFGLAVTLFFREFLAPLDAAGRRVFVGLCAAFAFTGVSSLLGIPVYSALIQHVTTFSLMVAVPLLLWQAVRSYRAGHQSASYFLLGWSLPLFSIPLRLLAEYGVIEWGFWIRYAPRLGFLFEAMVFALGLADRILRIRIERDRAEQARVRTERSLDRYRQLAEADALTGLSSRRALESELQRWDAEAIGGCCLFIDLDHFKQFNDRHGHAEGDDALRRVAAELRAMLPPGTHLARYGGEEFVALLPAASLEEGAALAEQARRRIASEEPSGRGHAVSISIGVAATRNDQPVAATLSRADAALYRAKSAGRNRVESDTAASGTLPQPPA